MNLLKINFLKYICSLFWQMFILYGKCRDFLLRSKYLVYLQKNKTLKYNLFAFINVDKKRDYLKHKYYNNLKKIFVIC